MFMQLPTILTFSVILEEFVCNVHGALVLAKELAELDYCPLLLPHECLEDNLVLFLCVPGLVCESLILSGKKPALRVDL